MSGQTVSGSNAASPTSGQPGVRVDSRAAPGIPHAGTLASAVCSFGLAVGQPRCRRHGRVAVKLRSTISNCGFRAVQRPTQGVVVSIARIAGAVCLESNTYGMQMDFSCVDVIITPPWVLPRVTNMAFLAPRHRGFWKLQKSSSLPQIPQTSLLSQPRPSCRGRNGTRPLDKLPWGYTTWTARMVASADALLCKDPSKWNFFDLWSFRWMNK